MVGWAAHLLRNKKARPLRTRLHAWYHPYSTAKKSPSSGGERSHRNRLECDLHWAQLGLFHHRPHRLNWCLSSYFFTHAHRLQRILPSMSRWQIEGVLRHSRF